MSSKRERILKMLADGKISVSEAEELLSALGQETTENSGSGKAQTSGSSEPRYLRITVDPKRGDKKVNLRVPLGLVRAGVKLGGVLPDEAKGKISEALHAKGIDIDINRADGEKLAEIFRSLRDVSIDVDDDNEHIRIFAE